jgi:hypothetical protein
VWYQQQIYRQHLRISPKDVDFSARLSVLFILLLLSPIGDDFSPSFEQTWIPFSHGWIVPTLVRIGPVLLNVKSLQTAIQTDERGLRAIRKAQLSSQFMGDIIRKLYLQWSPGLVIWNKVIHKWIKMKYNLISKFLKHMVLWQNVDNLVVHIAVERQHKCRHYVYLPLPRNRVGKLSHCRIYKNIKHICMNS